MKIAIGCDHGGFLLKQSIVSHLTELGHEVKDFGCYSTDSIDYPDYAFPTCEAVAAGEFQRGIVICTTGIGVSICANKVKGIRCALCATLLQAEMTRKHNDTNVLALGAKVTNEALSKQIVDIWLATAYEGGRHARRVQKITDYENNH
jgi:ribose 5-phosphate isomerase B